MLVISHMHQVGNVRVEKDQKSGEGQWKDSVEKGVFLIAWKFKGQESGCIKAEFQQFMLLTVESHP